VAFVNKISNEEVASLEAVRFDGQIVIIDTDEALERTCQELSAERVLGFDTETRPSFKAGVTNKVALLQLSTYERCYLIRLCRVKFSSKLQRILERSDILKIGADVAGDLRSLGKLRSFTPRGFVDLQSEVVKFGIEDKSLRKMSGIILGKRVSKAQRLSNWEAQTFTDQQKMYAATDAWVCLKIFDRLNEANPLR
jgi:ribonuclease D